MKHHSRCCPRVHLKGADSAVGGDARREHKVGVGLCILTATTDAILFATAGCSVVSEYTIIPPFENPVACLDTRHAPTPGTQSASNASEQK